MYVITFLYIIRKQTHCNKQKELRGSYIEKIQKCWGDTVLTNRIKIPLVSSVVEIDPV